MKPKPGKRPRNYPTRDDRRPPRTTASVARLREIVAQVAGGFAADVLDLRVSASQIMRIVLDRDDGLSTNRLVAFIRNLREAMTEAGIDPGDFQIEVDSPGADRLLRTAEHFNRFAGQDIRISRRGPDGLAVQRVTLLGASDGGALIRDRDGAEATVDPAAVEEIRLVPDLGPPPELKSRKKRTGRGAG